MIQRKKYNLLIPSEKTQWLKDRHPNINSTELGALFNISKYATEFTLYHDKKAPDPPYFEDNDRMRAGRFLEPSIAEYAASELGIQCIDWDEYYFDPEIRQGTSFDYMLIAAKDNELNGAILEIKNVDQYIWRSDDSEWTDQNMPGYIEAQVQHQMKLSGVHHCVVAALVGGNDLKFYQRAFNHVIADNIDFVVKRFWNRIENNDEPDPDYSRDSDYILSMNKVTNGGIYDAAEDLHLLALVSEYDRNRKTAKASAETLKEIKAEISMIVGDNEEIIIPGWNCSFRSNKNGARTFRLTQATECENE